jgi:nitrogen fixation NifU-like protein
MRCLLESRRPGRFLPAEGVGMDYQKVLVEHYRRRDNEGKLEEPFAEGHMVNRSCGDELTLYLDTGVDKSGASVVRRVSYIGRGCSVCIASADILCSEIKGLSISRAREIAAEFLRSLQPHSEGDSGESAAEHLPGDIPALLALRDYPMRQKCATMAWNILLE